MRDVLILAIVIPGLLYALSRPWIGVLVWEWLGIMNPHRYTYGFAYSAPLSALTVVATFIGLIVSRHKLSPLRGGSAMRWLLAFVVWVSLSWMLGADASGDYEQWTKVMKIDVMLFVALAVIVGRAQIQIFIAVVTLSIAILAAKGGVFTLATGGSYKVWGPPGSFIEDNNEFALASIMTIPLLYFLRLQVGNRWVQRLLLATMVLCGASALGSQSRGALLASGAMLLLFWMRSGGNKLKIALVIVALALPLVMFMPDTWTHRMSTIKTYQDDESAMGRINAWHVAWRIAGHYLLGVGFNPATPTFFAMYAPNPADIHAAHSIYFQVLGNHGFGGLLLFLAIWISTWQSANWIRQQRDLPAQAQWATVFASMAQATLAAYLVGGAFLSLAYFDLPYTVAVAVAATRHWVSTRGWVSDQPVLSSAWSRRFRWLRLARES